MVVQLSAITLERCPRSAWNEAVWAPHAAAGLAVDELPGNIVYAGQREERRWTAISQASRLDR